MIKIDPEFKQLIPPLSPEEYAGLKASLIADGCRDALVVWNGVIVDGHNRYEICTALGIEYETVNKDFETREDALVWIIDNQLARRNLAPYSMVELAILREPLFAAKAKKNIQIRKGNQPGATSQNSAKLDKIDTREEIAKIAGVSHDTIARVKKIKELAPEEIIQKVRNNEISINKAYSDIKRQESEKEQEQKKISNPKPPEGKYKTIVIDPPWDMKKIIREVSPDQAGFDYPTMSIDEIKDFELPFDEEAHIYMWTTQKYLQYAFDIFEAWGIKYIFTMTWHKNGGFQPFGLPQYNSEFVVFGRIGGLKFEDTKAFNTCFNANRREHSRKPDEFYDLVRRVSPGPRIDIFAREKRDGFDIWGNETGVF